MPDKDKLKKLIADYDNEHGAFEVKPIKYSKGNAAQKYKELGRANAIDDFDISSEQTHGQRHDTISNKQSMLLNMWNSFNNSIDEIDKGRYEGEADEIRHQMDVLEEQLYSGEYVDESLQEDIMSQIEALSVKMQEAQENIKVQEEDIESSPVDADYAYRQQELLNEEYTGLSNYIQYEIPKDLGGTASEWGTQAGLLLKNYAVSGKLKKMLLKNALKSSAAEVLSPAAHAVIAGGLTAVDVVTDLMALYKMRENETNAESSEALRERMGVILEENGLTQEDYANLDEPTQRQIRMEAWKGMDEFKARQMSLGTGDVLDKILLVSPWAKWGKGLSGFNRATRIGSTIAGQVLGSVTEGGEEGAQYSFSKDYVAGKYKDDPIGFDTFIDAQYELFKAGKYTLGGEHRFEDELDFRNAVRSGALLGGMMMGTGNANSIKNTITDYNAIKRDVATNQGVLLNQEWEANKVSKFSEYIKQGRQQEFKEVLRNMKDHTSPETYTVQEVENTEKEFNEADNDYKALRKKFNTPVGKESADIIFPEYLHAKTEAKAVDKEVAGNELKIANVLAENNVVEDDLRVLEIKKAAIENTIKHFESITDKSDRQETVLKTLKKDLKQVEKQEKETFKLAKDSGVEVDLTPIPDFIALAKLYANTMPLKAVATITKKELAKFNSKDYIIQRAKDSVALQEKVKAEIKKESKKKVKDKVEKAETKEEVDTAIEEEKAEVDNNKDLSEEQKEKDKEGIEKEGRKAEQKKKEDPQSDLAKEEDLEELNKGLEDKGEIPVGSEIEAEEKAKENPVVKEAVEEGKERKQKKKKEKRKKKQLPKGADSTPNVSKAEQITIDFGEDVIKPVSSPNATASASFIPSTETKTGKGKQMIPKDDLAKTIWERTNNLYITSGQLKSGDKVFYEYNTEGHPTIEVIKYEGDRRIVVGLLKTGDVNTSLINVFKERVGETTGEIHKFDDLFTTVDEMGDSAIAYDTDTYHNIKDVLREDQPLILGVVRFDGQGSYLEIPDSVKSANNIVSLPFTHVARKGKTHLVIQKPNGTWFATPLHTKKLGDVPQLEAKVTEILTKAQEEGIAGTAMELKETLPQELYDILPLDEDVKAEGASSYQLQIYKDGTFELAIYKDDKQITAYRNNSVAEFVNTLSDKLLLQVDATRLAEKGYVDSILNRLSTDLNPKVHFVGASVKLNPFNTEEVSKEKPTKEAKAKKGYKGRGSTLRRSAKRFNTNYKKWNSKKQMSWFKGAYKGVPISMHDDLMEVSKYGEDSWGLFLNGAVHIARNAAKGTAYHEGFHVVMNMFLNERQRTSVLREAEKTYSHLMKQKKYQNEVMDIMADFDINEEQAYKVWLEEQLAEDFRMYMQDREGVERLLPKKIADFFRKMYILVKDMLGMGLTKDEVFFYSARNGYNNPIFTRTLKEVRTHRNRVAGFGVVELNDTVRELNNFVINTILPDIYETGIEDVFTGDTTKAINNLYNDLIVGMEYDFSNGIYSEEHTNYLKKILNNIGTYTIIRDKQGDPSGIVDFKGKELYKKLVEGLRAYGININVRNNKIEKTDGSATIEEDLEADEKDNHANGYSLTEASISSWQRAGVRLKAFLSSIPKVSSSTKEVITRNGAIQYHNGAVLFNKLIEELNGTYSVSSYKAKLNNLIEHEPSVKFIYEALFPDTVEFDVNEGNPIKINVKDKDKMLTELYARTGSVAKKAPMVIKENIESTQDGIKRSMTTFNSARNGAENKFMSEWKGNSAHASYKEGDIAAWSEILLTAKKDIFKAIQKNDSYDNIKDSLDVFEEVISGLGIAISKNDIAKLYNSKSIVKLLGNKGMLPSLLTSIAKGNDIFDDVNSTYVNNIAKLFKKAIPEMSQLSYISEGKTKYVITNPNFLAKFISNIKNTSIVEEIAQHYNEDVYFLNSPLLQELFNNPDKASKLDYAMFDTLIDKDNNDTDYTKLNKAQFKSLELNAFLSNSAKPNSIAYYTTPIPSDAPQMPLVKYIKEDNAVILDKMYGVYEQERARINTVKEELSGLEDNDKISNIHEGNGTKFHFLPFLNNVKNNLKLSEEEVKDEVKKYLDRQAESYMEELVEEGVISVKENKNGDKVYFVSNKNKTIPSDLNVRGVVKNFIYNDYYMQSQIVTMTGVDPSYYKNNVNFYKRAKQVYSPGSYINTDIAGETFKTVFLEDIETISEFKDAYYKNLILSGFSEDVAVRISSAYGYANKTESYKDKNGKFVLAEGLTEEERKGKTFYNIDSKGNPHEIQVVNSTDGQSFISIDRYRLLMDAQGKLTDSLKQTIDNIKAGKATPGEIRQILMPIKPFYYGHVKTSYTLKDGTVMTKIIPMQIKNSESVLLPEFAKGNPKLENIVKMFDKGISSVQFNSAVKVGASGVANEATIADGTYKVHTLNNADYRIQQETPEHHIDTSSLFGTQIRRLIMADLAGDNYLYGGKYTAKQLVKEFSDLISLNIKESYEQIKHKFNKDNIKETLTDAIIDRQLGDQYLEALEKLPLYDPIHVKRIEAMMSSIIRNGVTQQKFNGGSFVNTSSYGLSNKLKTVFNDGGGIEYMEAIMPAWSKDMVDENGFIQLSKIDPKLLEGILYRIPNEDKYSMFNIKVIEFLPEHDGGKILLPDDVTTIAGLDFDIDKLYAMMYEFEKDADGNLTKKDSTDNKILDLMMVVLKDPKSLESRLNPGNFKKFKAFRDKFFPVTDNDSSIISTDTKYSIYYRNMAAADMIGIMANNNTSHALMQHYNVGVRVPIIIDDVEKFSLSETHNEEGERISKEVASILAAVLDNAGDPISGDVNLNTFTVGSFSLLLRLGFSLDNSLLFINQPIIKEFTRLYIKAGATGSAFEKIKADFDRDLNIDEEEESKQGVIVLNKLEESLHDELGKTYEQREVYRAFRKIKSTGDELGEVTRALRVEKGSGTSLAYNEEYVELVEGIKFGKGVHLYGASEMFSDEAIVGWVNSLYEYGIVKANEHIGEYIPYLEAKFKSYKNGVTIETDKGSYKVSGIRSVSKRKLRAEEKDVVNAAILDYMHSGLTSLNLNGEAKADFLNDVEERLIAYKKSNPESDYQDFIGMIISQELSNPKDVKRMLTVADKKGKDKLAIDDIRYLWEGMAEDGTTEEQDLANDLVKYAYYTTGFAFSPVGLSSLIPVSLKAKYKLDDKNIDWTAEVSVNQAKRFTEQFIRNNYKKLNYLPTVVAYEQAEEFINKDTLKQDDSRNKEWVVVVEEDGKALFKKSIDKDGNVTHIRTEALGTNFINEYESNKDNLVSLFNEASELVKTEKPTAKEETIISQEATELWEKHGEAIAEKVPKATVKTIQAIIDKYGIEEATQKLKDCY
jgi:hypothetical protein